MGIQHLLGAVHFLWAPSRGLKFTTWASLRVCSCAVSYWGAWEMRCTGWKAGPLAVEPPVSLQPLLVFQESLDAMLQWLLQRHHREDVVRAGLCTEGALLLLEMLKATMSQVSPPPPMP